ncbi:hypothetical protein IAT38_000025 [Cryptococcus sp. DSM 104549]
MPAFTSRSRVLFTTYRPYLLSMGFSAILPVRALSHAPKPNEATCTRYLWRNPSPAASRESPYPVVFLRATGLGVGEDVGEWADWSGMFAEKGYTSIEIDITPPSTPTRSTLPGASPSSDSPDAGPASPLPTMVTALSSQIRLMAIPFPPLLIARGQSSLLAQAYLEDHPASGLVIVDPLPDADPRDDAAKAASGGWAWPVFKYEPHFPLLVVGTHEGLAKASTENRLVREHSGVDPNPGKWFGGRGRGKGVELAVRDEGELGEQARVEVERWMDRAGF